MFGAKIVGLGAAIPGTNIPGEIVTNEMLAGELRARRDRLEAAGTIIPPEHKEQFETSDDWIGSRTGIRERRRLGRGWATADLAAVAGKEALDRAGWKPEDVQFILLATVSPDHIITPPTVPIIQHKLGIPVRNALGHLREIDGSDITSACSSFGRALKFGWSYCASGLHERGLVIGADVMSSTMNQFSREALPIFGDAGGAIALERTTAEDDAFFGPRSFFSGMDGSLADLIMTPIGGSRTPLDDPDIVANPFDQRHRVVMQGKSVKRVVERLILPKSLEDETTWPSAVLTGALLKAGIALDKIDGLLLHQANGRINERIAERLRAAGFKGRIFSNIDRYGNTTSASVLLLLYEAWRNGDLKPGGIYCIVVFGGGFSWEVIFFRWPLDFPSPE